MTKIQKNIFVYFLPLLSCVTGCRENELVVPTEYEVIPEVPSADSAIQGFYLVNEGNMGSNKCSLDYFDYSTGIYSRNIYAERNPNVVKELGDVGNDIGVYGSKLYVVVNCSHKVEVVDSHSGVRIGQVDIPNCRYVRFHRGKAYVSSYVGPVQVGVDTPKGAIYEVDTLSLAVTAKVTVGYQPEEMEIVGDYMYVANSGGYRAPQYDNTVSVIQMSDFKQVQQIPVDINLHRVKKDRYDKLWINSRGDNQSHPSCLYVLSRKSGESRLSLERKLDIRCSNMAIKGDSLYYFATGWNASAAENEVSYGIIDVRSQEVVSESFITDGTDREITVPYGIAVHPENGDIFVTDAKNYVSSGTLYCFDRHGRKKWSVRTGDIPSQICFLPK